MPNRARDWFTFYIPPRYPNSHPEGAPFEHYGPLQSEEAIRYAHEILGLSRSQMAWSPIGRPSGTPLGRERRATTAGCGRIGYFGSYARGDWGVGSDLDMVVVVESSDQPFQRRAATWDRIELPVPTDLLVYTEEEWRLLGQQGRFSHTVMKETVWV